MGGLRELWGYFLDFPGGEFAPGLVVLVTPEG